MRGPLVQRKPRSEKSSGIAKRPLSTDGRRSALNRGRCVNYLLVGDYANIEKEIRLRFSKIQQNPLRSIAKAIIQRVEPSKQRDHPYTESRKGEMGGEEKKDAPTKVPSPWWPSDIKWREPDHLKMAGMLVTLQMASPLMAFRPNIPLGAHRPYVPQKSGTVASLFAQGRAPQMQNLQEVPPNMGRPHVLHLGGRWEHHGP